MSENKQFTALVNYACPVCGKVDEKQSAILLHKNLKDISDLHGQTIDIAEHPCDDCKSMMERGVVLVEVNAQLTTDPRNPYRTGNIACVTEEYIREALVGDIVEDLIKKRVGFIPTEVTQALGIDKHFKS